MPVFCHSFVFENCIEYTANISTDQNTVFHCVQNPVYHCSQYHYSDWYSLSTTWQILTIVQFFKIIHCIYICSVAVCKPLVLNMGAKYAHNNVALCMQTKGSSRAMWWHPRL